eukprot:2223903-Alexandrium_andersonii.AAC.1
MPSRAATRSMRIGCWLGGMAKRFVSRLNSREATATGCDHAAGGHGSTGHVASPAGNHVQWCLGIRTAHRRSGVSSSRFV